MIPVTDTLYLDEDELDFQFVRSPGPGGQNVNKVATAVQLRFDIASSRSIPDHVKLRLEAIAGRRINKEKVLVIFAHTYRSQERNKQDAVSRLVGLLKKAAFRPKKRIATKPSFASQQERINTKVQRSQIKNLRKKDFSFD